MSFSEIAKSSLNNNFKYEYNSLYNYNSSEARVFNSSGIKLAKLGKHSEALQKFEQALENWQEILVKEHPQIATVLSHIGECFQAQGKYKEALEKFELSLEIREESLGKEHPDVEKTNKKINECIFDGYHSGKEDPCN